MTQLKDDSKDETIDFVYEGREGVMRGWLKMELVGKKSIPDESLPFRRGSLIRIKKSPRPDKIPDNAIAMFIDYNWSTFKILKPEIRHVVQDQTITATCVTLGDVTSDDQKAQEMTQQVQYRMKVLFDEKVVEIFNTQPEELGENYIHISDIGK